MSFSAKSGHISNLRLKTEQKLYKMLNRQSILAEDYQDFASHLGLQSDDLATISQLPNPTKEILQWWKCKPKATIRKLILILIKMDRLDCVEILKEDPLFDECGDVKDTIEKYIDVHEQRNSFTTNLVSVSSGASRRKDIFEIWTLKGLILLGDLKESTYNKVCDDLNYQPNPPSTFSLLAEEMGYNMGKIREFKNSTNPTDALLQDWEKRPGNGVNELIKLLKKVERKALAEMLEKEVEEILERRENLDVKPKRKADQIGEGPEKKRKSKACKE